MKITLKQLIERYNKGENITFDECNHPRIPNTAKSNSAIIGDVSANTIKAFKNWKFNNILKQ